MWWRGLVEAEADKIHLAVDEGLDAHARDVGDECAQELAVGEIGDR